MEKLLKVCNLYCGLGGNRKLWENVEITAVEINPDIAKIYQEFFPDDTVIVGDAHQYLLENYDKGWDFIWGSPPCPSHSDVRRLRATSGLCAAIYPDMKLYEEIIFLNTYFKGLYVVENVIAYYKPLHSESLRLPQKLDRHHFWTNFHIAKIEFKKKHIIRNVQSNDTVYGRNISAYNLDIDKRQVLRNQVNPELGFHILECARAKIENRKIDQEQPDLFI